MLIEILMGEAVIIGAALCIGVASLVVYGLALLWDEIN
jgi:hypothetical protein